MIQTEKNEILEELAKALEPVIRRIIREELERIAEERPNIFFLEPDMPLYADMLEIKSRSMKRELDFFRRKEVWGD